VPTLSPSPSLPPSGQRDSLCLGAMFPPLFDLDLCLLALR
jgi:hypothetical protein